jgi:hypothetical protein
VVFSRTLDSVAGNSRLATDDIGTPYFTPLAKPLDLRLTESRTFGSRVVYRHYQRTR